MLATAKDSKSDVLATVVVIIALIASVFTDLPVDGAMGVIVSAFVLKSGYDIVRDTVDELWESRRISKLLMILIIL